MISASTSAIAFWGFLFLCGGLLYAITSHARTVSALFKGSGKYALRLGTNLYGLLICFAGFLLPLAWQSVTSAHATATRP